jgi:hypothetical protein
MKIGKVEAARLAAAYGVTCAAGVAVTACPAGGTVTPVGGMSCKEMTALRGRNMLRQRKFERAALRAAAKERP